MSIPDLPTLRVQYADARAALRRSTDVFERTKAACADNIVVRANGDLGKNADDRKRAVQAALIHDPDYLQALDALRVAEQQAEHLQALIDAQAALPVAKRTPYPWEGEPS